MKTTRIFHLEFSFFMVKFSVYLNRRVFVMFHFCVLCYVFEMCVLPFKGCDKGHKRKSEME